LTIANAQLTFGLNVDINLCLNRGMTYDITNNTAKPLKILQNGHELTTGLTHSDGSTGAAAQGKSNGVLTYDVATDAENISFVTQTDGSDIVSADINTNGPLLEKLGLSSISTITVVDGLIFARDTNNNLTSDTVGFIKLSFSSSTPEQYKQYAREAAGVWASIIDATIFDAPFASVLPNGFQTTMRVELSNQGSNGTLAYAGVMESYVVPPQPYHTAGGYLSYTYNGTTGFLIPTEGLMNINTAYTASMEANNTIVDVITHEMGHILGLGSFWSAYNEIPKDSSGYATAWKGAQANAFYQSIGGVGDVPIEDQYGPGTQGAHWDEQTFDTELMTGFAENSDMPLSKMTAYALADMGWKVNLDSEKIDAFVLPSSNAVSVQSGNCCSVHAFKPETVKLL
jgi:hypothetical protein